MMRRTAQLHCRHEFLGARPHNNRPSHDDGRLESIADVELTASAEELLARAGLRLTTARSALAGGDVGGVFVSAYDSHRMAADSLLLRQALRASGGAGSHTTVEDAVSHNSVSAFIVLRNRRSRDSAAAVVQRNTTTPTWQTPLSPMPHGRLRQPTKQSTVHAPCWPRTG